MTDEPKPRTFKRLMELVAKAEDQKLRPWEKVNFQELGLDEQALDAKLEPLTEEEFQLFAEGEGYKIKALMDRHNLHEMDELLQDILWGDHLYHFFFVDTVM